jgi:hypothetical protein
VSNEEWLRIGKAAEELEVGAKTLGRWIALGLVRHKRTLGGGIGRGHARIHKDEVTRLKQLMEQGVRIGASRPEPSEPAVRVPAGMNGSGRVGPPARPDPNP